MVANIAAGATKSGTGPLYLFSLPPALLENFKPRQLNIPEDHPLHAAKKEAESLAIELPASSSNTLAIGGAFTCTLTGASFPDLVSLREHYKTDWYKYNVKLRLQGKPTGVTEEEFDALVEGEELPNVGQSEKKVLTSPPSPSPVPQGSQRPSRAPIPIPLPPLNLHPPRPTPSPAFYASKTCQKPPKTRLSTT